VPPGVRRGLSEAVKAALLSGLLSEFVVLVGVLLADWLAGRREQGSRVDNLSFRLIDQGSELENRLKEIDSHEIEPHRQEVVQLQTQVRTCAFELRALLLGQPRCRALAKAVDELLARQFVAYDRYEAGIPMELLETLGIAISPTPRSQAAPTSRRGLPSSDSKASRELMRRSRLRGRGCARSAVAKVLAVPERPS
jgi:hypothetical protein